MPSRGAGLEGPRTQRVFSPWRRAGACTRARRDDPESGPSLGRTHQIRDAYFAAQTSRGCPAYPACGFSSPRRRAGRHRLGAPGRDRPRSRVTPNPMPLLPGDQSVGAVAGVYHLARVGAGASPVRLLVGCVMT